MPARSGSHDSSLPARSRWRAPLRMILPLMTLVLACQSAPAPAPFVTRSRYLMGTICEISVPPSPTAEEQIAAGFAEIARVEALLSTWKDDSELSRLNRAPQQQPFAVSEELFCLLNESLGWARKTGGAFNPLIGPLVDVWKTRDEGRLPDAMMLEAAISR